MDNLKILNKLEENNKKIDSLCNPKEFPDSRLLEKSQEIKNEYFMKLAILKYFISETITGKATTNLENRIVMSQENKIQDTKQFISLHNTKEHGNIDNLTYNIIYNLFDWHIYFIPNVIQVG